AQKIKKQDDHLQLQLEKTTDILAELGKRKQAHQWLVGFALESQHDASLALEKLQRKNLDMIVLNSLDDPGAGFAGDSNKISIFDRLGHEIHFPLKHKHAVAHDIIQALLDLMHAT